MHVELTPHEARVIGSLIEKEITTPDQYPLSLGALTAACNQKTNREPVLNLAESEVQELVDGLAKKHLVMERSGFGSRVPKYQHRFCNTDFGDLHFTAQELGVICVLFLRGPQTPGELRTRTNRLCEFADVHETEAVLQKLMEREDGPYVVRLPREPGKRESRYMHLFSGTVEGGLDTMEAAPAPVDDLRERVASLEEMVLELRAQLDVLESRLEHHGH